MEEVLLERRILKDNSNYKLSKDIKDFKPKTSLKSKREIKYKKRGNKIYSLYDKEFKGSSSLDNDNNKAEIYIKYGPFVVFLTNYQSKSYWGDGFSAVDYRIINK